MERICRISLGINPSRIRANSTGKATRAGLVEIKGHTPQDDDEPFFCSLHRHTSCPRKAGCQMATNSGCFAHGGDGLAAYIPLVPLRSVRMCCERRLAKLCEPLRPIVVPRMVVGVGFEPTNARSGRIYSPHPLATWIPYQLKKKTID